MFARSAPSRGRWSRGTVAAVSAVAAAGLVIAGCSASSSGPANQQLDAQHWGTGRTATPIKHVVVLFDENISFDHYFGTYPNATNTDGTPFHALPGTPKVNGLSPGPADQQPELLQPAAADPAAGADLRPEPRLRS